MKKITLIVAGMGISMLSWAQKQNIQSANNYLRDKEYTKALEYIEKAVNDPSTKDDPKAWFVRGNIYMSMQDDGGYKAQAPYREAVRSYMKANELKPAYEKDAIGQALLVSAYSYYNDAANAYNAKNYSDAYNFAKQLETIHGLDAGKRYSGNKGFDTVSIQGQVIGAYSAYYSENYDNALPMLNALKNDPIGKTPNIYLLMADIYRKQNKDAEYLAVLTEARKQYPDNQNIRNEELNYYIRTNQQDALIQKLEGAVAGDPNNAELQYTLANSYSNLANPKEGKKPANAAELLTKAEAAYTKVLGIDPNNAAYNYNAGAFYFNQATDINDQMNQLDNSAASQKKYNELVVKRDAMFGKALPYLEKTISIFEPKLSTLSVEDKRTYSDALQAGRQIYAIQNKMDKASELKKKQDAIPQ